MPLTFADLAKDHPVQLVRALATLDPVRLAELADRNDPAALGALVLHALDVKKHAVEQALAEPAEFHWPGAGAGFAHDPEAALEIPAFLRRQAD